MNPAQLQDEISLHQSLPWHPHVAKLHAVLPKLEEITLILELTTGGTLFDHVCQHERLDEIEARRLFRQLISGLAHCHHHGVAHRDLKLENLLLDGDHNLKIADFGLAASVVDGELLTSPSGSPNYTAPELLDEARAYAGQPADVWSCGVVLFALLTGSFPFDHPRPDSLFRRIRKSKYSTPSYVSAEAANLISQMLTVDVSARIDIHNVQCHPWFSDSNLPDLAGDLAVAADVSPSGN